MKINIEEVRQRWEVLNARAVELSRDRGELQKVCPHLWEQPEPEEVVEFFDYMCDTERYYKNYCPVCGKQAYGETLEECQEEMA